MLKQNDKTFIPTLKTILCSSEKHNVCESKNVLVSKDVFQNELLFQSKWNNSFYPAPLIHLFLPPVEWSLP